MMNAAYTQLVSRFMFPLHERLKRHSTVAVRTQMEKDQWLEPEQLKALQLERLQSLLVSVHEHVPYYQEQFQQLGIQPAAIKSLKDLQQLPFLDKPLIRASVERLKASNAGPMVRGNTGGSSGEPMIFFLGMQRVSEDVAAKWRATRWWDVDIGDAEAVIWGSPIELGAQDRVRLVRDQLFRSELYPAFEMSEQKLDEYIAQLRKQKPKMLFGYPSSIALIAKHAKKRGVRMDDLGAKVTFVTAERLYDEQAEVIKEVFGTPIANGYGSRDAGFLAHQCPHGGMHITADSVIIEIVDRDGRVLPDGEAGEIVVTNLSTAEFPLIRYRTGDVGVIGQQRCSCGRGLPLLQEVQGRTTDFIVAKDGTIMHGLALIYSIRDLEGVQAFKIIQESLDNTRVLLAAGARFPADGEQLIVKDFKARLGQDVDIAVERVDEIPPEKSGKHRYVVSHVA